MCGIIGYSGYRACLHVLLEGLEKLDQMEVDICLPSHTNQVGILLLKDQIREDFNPYYDPSIWHELMQERLARARKILNQAKAEE